MQVQANHYSTIWNNAGQRQRWFYILVLNDQICCITLASLCCIKAETLCNWLHNLFSSLLRTLAWPLSLFLPLIDIKKVNCKAEQKNEKNCHNPNTVYLMQLLASWVWVLLGQRVRWDCACLSYELPLWLSSLIFGNYCIQSAGLTDVFSAQTESEMGVASSGFLCEKKTFM